MGRLQTEIVRAATQITGELRIKSPKKADELQAQIKSDGEKMSKLHDQYMQIAIAQNNLEEANTKLASDELALKKGKVTQMLLWNRYQLQTKIAEYESTIQTGISQISF